MANYRAIAAASAAIRELLRERYPRDEFGPSLTIDSYHVNDLDQGIGTEGFAILLWRVMVNTERRARPPRKNPLGGSFRPSLPLDLSYLLIPVSTSVERQQRMLGWMMRALEDAGPFSAAQLNNYLAEDDIFPASEDIELVCDPLPLADHLNLWERIKRYPTYANYLMRMVVIDSDVEITENAPVIEREFQYSPAGVVA